MKMYWSTAEVYKDDSRSKSEAEATSHGIWLILSYLIFSYSKPCLSFIPFSASSVLTSFCFLRFVILLISSFLLSSLGSFHTMLAHSVWLCSLICSCVCICAYVCLWCTCVYARMCTITMGSAGRLHSWWMYQRSPSSAIRSRESLSSLRCWGQQHLIQCHVMSDFALVWLS